MIVVTATGIVVEVSRGIEEEGGTVGLQRGDEMNDTTTRREMIIGVEIVEVVIVVSGETAGIVVEVSRGIEGEGVRVGLQKGDEMKDTTTIEMTIGGESGGKGSRRKLYILTN